uniref:nucleolin-like isoform X2 n=1 Tax=Scatophagus argus TaxID=75038 RepID=UPI001ED830AC|nr:nucleolin-like isoform X2 [Scatophagus argus]
MAKTDAIRRRKRQSKVVANDAVEEDNINTDSQMNTVIEVKGSKSTVTVSWDKKNEEGEMDDPEMRTSASCHMMDIESQMDTVAGETENTSTETVTSEKKNEEGESNDIKKETNGEQKIKRKEKKAVNGKRKTPSTVESSPSKKAKLINDGFCLFVGNLNNSKTFEEVKDALGKYFMAQSVLVQDVRLDRSKKHAYLDLASEMDLTKALTLHGEMVLDKPMKIERAKIKNADKVKAKVPAEDKKATDARCLFLKNVPYNATKQDILKIFHKAVDVRFPGGTESPNKGIAFVEFKNKTIVRKIQRKKRVLKIQDRVLTVDFVGEANQLKVTKTDDDNTAAAPPNNTLFVTNLSFGAKQKDLRNVFQKAVSITIPQSKGKSRGFAFVEFANVADAEKALQSSQNMKISKREVRVHFYKMKEMSQKAKVLTKTLIVRGLDEKTSAETLKSAFEGSLSARVIADKETGVSKRFGFVDFETDENCKAVKEAMEDCEIDGSKVTVAYAKSKDENASPRARESTKRHPAGQPADQRAARGGRSSRGGRGRGAGKSQDAVKQMET